MKRQDILSIRAGTSRMFYGIHPRQVSVARSMIQNIKMFGEMPPDVERYITSTGGKPGQLVITAVPAKDKVQFNYIQLLKIYNNKMNNWKLTNNN